MASERDFVLVETNDGEDYKFTKVTVPEQFDCEWYMNDLKEKSEFDHCGWVSIYRKYCFVNYISSYLCDNSADKITVFWSETLVDAKNELSYANKTGVIYDVYEETSQLIKVFSWENKEGASSQEEALEFIANYLAKDFETLDSIDIKEAEDYAAKWNIPFSMNLMTKFKGAFDFHHSQWNSSSAYC